MNGEDSRLTSYQKARLQSIGHRAVQTRLNEVLAPFELNTSQWIILGWLYDIPEGLRVSGLAAVLDVEVPLITNLLQPLQTQRLVTLRTDPEDKRAKLVRLTERGIGLVPRLEAEMTTHLAIFDRHLRPGEMQTYFRVLEKFIRSQGSD